MLPHALAALAMAIAAPGAASAQLTSARPASVALTVVVSPRTTRPSPVREGTVVVRATAMAVDVQTTLDLGDASASRVEVRLANGLPSDSLRLWVRGTNGGFERLDGRARVLAATGAPAVQRPGAPAHLQFRVESDRPIAGTAIAIPMEYRVTTGSGDRIAIWSFPSVMRLEIPR